MKSWMDSSDRQQSQCQQQDLFSPSLLLSFVAGASSTALLCWWTLSRGRGSRSASKQEAKNQHEVSWLHHDEAIDTNDGTGTSTSTAAQLAWVDEIKSRIGELPKASTRMRWPWDKSRTDSTNKEEMNHVEHDENYDHGNKSAVPLSPRHEQQPPPPPPPPLSPQDKTGLCIGSIFGLDVGGTLAKLVYFEQRQNEHLLFGTHRQQAHHKSASARLILNARRMPRRATTTGATVTSTTSSTPLHTVESEQDLQPLYLVRQESLPDDLADCEELFPTPEFSSRESLEYRWNDQEASTETTRTTVPLGSHLEEEEVDNKNNNMKKSRSMLDISKSRDHAEALDRFYDFARRLDVYETAVKDKNLSFYSRELGGDFHFIRFETRRMDNAMHLIRVNDLHRNIRTMGATGGGAHKYAADWERVLGIQMEKQDELDSLVAGMQFVMSTAIGECYTYRARALDHQETSTASSFASATTDRATNQMDAALQWDDGSDTEDESSRSTYQGDEWSWTRKVQRDVAAASSSYPYLLVTIGTGVSVLRVDGPRRHERISGSTIGGGTYWGLMRLLTDVETFEDAMKLAERGDPTKVDMMVGDIYGHGSDALDKVGLPANLVASSFGKLVGKQDPAKGVKQEDLARALLLMTTNNIGQVAYLNAKLSSTPRIYFVGNFLRQNQISQHRLSYAINYWSRGEMEALFLEHEGYFGAIGAFLLSQSYFSGKESEEEEEPSKTAQNGVRHRRSRTMSSVH